MSVDVKYRVISHKKKNVLNWTQVEHERMRACNWTKPKIPRKGIRRSFFAQRTYTQRLLLNFNQMEINE